MNPKKENRPKVWFFTAIAAIWIIATMIVVGQASPKAYVDSGSNQKALADYQQLLEEQRELMVELEDLHGQIRGLDFGIYQDFKVMGLQDRISKFTDSTRANSAHMIRMGRVFDMLLKSRQELVTEQRNILRNSEAVLNCQKGNQTSATP